MNTQENNRSNIIDIKNKLTEKRQNRKALADKQILNGNTRVISITSGKGGVGKTNIVANLGISFSQMGKRVLIFDADLGLGNLDILLGMAPRYNLSHVISHEKTLSDIIIEGPGGIHILPASSGIHEFAQLSQKQRQLIISALDDVLKDFDILLIDTAAGISSDVMYFNTVAQEVVVVASPEPTSITDAYALMKVLSMKYSAKAFKLLINQANDTLEAKEVYRQLRLVTDRFLNISVEYFGHVAYDRNVTNSVKKQKAVTELYPSTVASQCFKSMAQSMLNASVMPLFPCKNSIVESSVTHNHPQ